MWLEELNLLPGWISDFIICSSLSHSLKLFPFYFPSLLFTDLLFFPYFIHRPFKKTFFTHSDFFALNKMYATACALLISIYLSIVLLTGSLLFLITKFLKDKPFGQQFVTDKLSADLAIFVFMTNFFLSFAIIIRELIGPFCEDTTQIVLAIQQFFNLSILMCLLAMQFAQFCNVFFSSR